MGCWVLDQNVIDHMAISDVAAYYAVVATSTVPTTTPTPVTSTVTSAPVFPRPNVSPCRRSGAGPPANTGRDYGMASGLTAR